MVVRRSRSVLLACSALLAFGLGTASYAQTATQNDAATDDAAPKGDRVTALKPIVVKGKAAKDVLADSPTTTETTAQQIDDKQITRIEDLGRSTEVGVGYNRTTGGINIRGLGDDRVLTTVDGIEIPYMLDVARGADGGVNSFDFNSLSSVDVVRGADSSRAGSGALGGAFVLRTLEPEDLITPVPLGAASSSSAITAMTGASVDRRRLPSASTTLLFCSKVVTPMVMSLKTTAMLAAIRPSAPKQIQPITIREAVSSRSANIPILAPSASRQSTTIKTKTSMRCTLRA